MFVDKQLSLFKNFLTFTECVYIHNIYVHTCTHILNVCADTVCTHAFTFPAKCNWDSLSTLRKNVMVEKVTEACKSTIHYSCLQISINTTIFCAVIWLNMVPKKCCFFFSHRFFDTVYLVLPSKEREWIRLPTLKTTINPCPFSNKKFDCQNDGEDMCYS